MERVAFNLLRFLLDFRSEQTDDFRCHETRVQIPG